MFPTLQQLDFVGVTFQGTLHILVNIQYLTLINILPYKNISSLNKQAQIHFLDPKLVLTVDKILY